MTAVPISHGAESILLGVGAARLVFAIEFTAVFVRSVFLSFVAFGLVAVCFLSSFCCRGVLSMSDLAGILLPSFALLPCVGFQFLSLVEVFGACLDSNLNACLHYYAVARLKRRYLIFISFCISNELKFGSLYIIGTHMAEVTWE